MYTKLCAVYEKNKQGFLNYKFFVPHILWIAIENFDIKMTNIWSFFSLLTISCSFTFLLRRIVFSFSIFHIILEKWELISGNNNKASGRTEKKVNVAENFCLYFSQKSDFLAISFRFMTFFSSREKKMRGKRRKKGVEIGLCGATERGKKKKKSEVAYTC